MQNSNVKLQKCSIFSLNGLNYLNIEYNFKTLNSLLGTGATVNVISKSVYVEMAQNPSVV